MHRCAHTSSEVGWARSDVTEMFIIGERGLLLNLGSGNRESFKDLSNVGALLHRDDTELILFVDPYKECLVFVVEDTTCFGPLTLESAALQVLVTSLEQEVIFDKLLFLSFSHAGKRVVLAFQFASEVLKYANHLCFNFSPLLCGDSSSERVVSHIASNTDPGRVDHSIFVRREVRAV